MYEWSSCSFAKMIPYGRIILTKGQLDHSYTFWIMANYTTVDCLCFFDSDVRRAACTKEGANGGNVWLYYNLDGFIVWKRSQIWIGKMLLYQCVQKSDNRQYNTLICWFTGTNYLSTKGLMFQVLFFIHNFMQNSLQKLFQFMLLCLL